MERSGKINTTKRMSTLLVALIALISVTYFVAVVLAADGDLDATFGSGGTVSAGATRTFFGANSGASLDDANAIGVLSTGKIIAGGLTHVGGGDTHFALVGYKADGTLDTTFGSGTGMVATDFFASPISINSQIKGLAIDPGTDKIVAVGPAQADNSGNSDWATARYNADGSLDTTFNTTGKKTIDFHALDDQPSGVVIQPDHKMVVFGFSHGGASSSTFNIALARLNSDGTLDSTFNGGNGANTSGKVEYDISTTAIPFFNAMVLIPSGANAGKIIGVGSFNANMAVARLNSDGSIDTAFGTSGKTVTVFSSGVDSEALSVALQGDGKIVAGGDYNDGVDFAMARYNSDGSLDTATFGAGTGKVITDFGLADLAKFAGVTSDGKIILAGQDSNFIAIARYNSNGSLDTSFGSGGTGKVTNNLGVTNARGRAGALLANGKILVGGEVDTGGGDDDFFIARFQNTVPPDLTITKSHVGNFTQGQTGATYTITVTNSGASSTSGSVTVTDTLPSGLTATAISGTNWVCTLGTVSCTRSDALAFGASYEPITLTVNVSGSAPASVTNSVTVAGGGETNTGNDTATDPTTVNPAAPDLTITKTHVGNFNQGQPGASYAITATNSGNAPTDGSTVTVSDSVPSGLTATGITGGVNWNCTQPAGPCTRNSVLAASASYETITLTVNVSASASSPQINSATVAGGGETNTANDTANDSTTINFVNKAPTLNGISDPAAILEDAGLQTVNLSGITAGAGESQTLTVTATSGNPAVIPNPTVTYTSPNSTGSLSYTPVANANGSAVITVTVQDNGGTANGGVDTTQRTFTVNVTGVNDPPSFTKGADQTVNEDAGAQTVNNWATAISAGPANESSQTVTFLVTNNNNALFSGQPAVSSTGTLTYTPAANANGSAIVTVRAQDNGGTANGGNDTSGAQTFNLTVNAVNDPPSFTKGPDQTVNEDASAQTVNNWATAISPGPADESGQTVTFQVTGNTNAGLFFLAPAISSTGTLTYTPAANANGTAAITINLKDNGGTANGGNDTSASQTFNITVNAVNDAPSFTKGPDQTANEDAGAQTVNNWATAISAGPANESSQTVTFLVTNNNNALFSGQPAVSSTGTLTYTPGANANGSAIVTVRAQDNGGTANGGVDTSAAQTFNITVNAVNDAPSFTKGPDQAVPMNVGAQTVSNWATNISAGPSDESSQTLTFQVTNNTNVALFSAQPAISATGTLTYTPASGASGIAAITINLKDNGGTANGGIDTSASQTFNITVTAGAILQFSASNYSVSESGGFVTITTTRTGDTSSAVNVDYATNDTGSSIDCSTVNGLASSRCDFDVALGTLRFAAGDLQKTFIVLINRDAYVEGSETFTVALSNATGGASLAAPSTSTITITDDNSGLPANGIDDTTLFVRQQYHDFLNREPDSSGLAFWKNNIDQCNDPANRAPGQTLAQCIEVMRINTSAAFFLSIEFQNSGMLVRSFYVAALNRPATNNMPAFGEFERDAQAVEQGVIVDPNNNAWQAVLNANRTAFMNDFVMRAEFVGLYPTTDTPAQYVDKLYLHAAITPSASERSNAIAEFGSATTAADPAARGRALLDITQNSTFQSREMNRAFVHMQYLGYLRRNPNDLPDSDFSGYNFWLNKLNGFNGNFIQAEMVKAFISSLEYRKRFGP